MRGKYKKEDHNVSYFLNNLFIVLVNLAGSKKSCFMHKFYWLLPHEENTVN